jgi:hypothetical protein
MDTAIYVQNTHTNGIKVGSGNRQKRFGIAVIDSETGRPLDSGYTKLTQEEYAWVKEDPLFKYFLGKKKLIVVEQLPLEAQTPHEALVAARKEVSAATAQLAALEAENNTLRQQVTGLEAEKTALQQQITGLEAEKAAWTTAVAAAETDGDSKAAEGVKF